MPAGAPRSAEVLQDIKVGLCELVYAGESSGQSPACGRGDLRIDAEATGTGERGETSHGVFPYSSVRIASASESEQPHNPQK